MKPNLPTRNDRGHLIFRPGDKGAPRGRPGTLNLKGDFRSHKLRVVCAPCNNGWMSVLQSDARPVLEPIIRGAKRKLSADEVRVLAAWVTMFVMVYEFSDPEVIGISEAQRIAFKADAAPQECWAIWMAPYRGDNLPAAHTAMELVDSKALDPIEAARRDPAQITLFGSGKVCFFAFSTGSPATFAKAVGGVENVMEMLGFVHLWPRTEGPVSLADGRQDRLRTSDLGDIFETITKYGLGLDPGHEHPFKNL